MYLLQCNPRLMATSVIWSPHYYNLFFWPQPTKTTIHFLVKKPTLVRLLIITIKFFWLIGDRINGVPLYIRGQAGCPSDTNPLKVNFKCC